MITAKILNTKARHFLHPWFLTMLMGMFMLTNASGQASSYTFAESTTTWTEIIGGTASVAAGDDGFEIVNLPMPFSFNGSPVTQVTISTNGVLRLASGNLSSSWTNDMANTTRTPVAAPYWDDHHLVAGTGTITYTVLGTAPTRKFVVQWKDVTTSGSGSNTSTTKASFQVALVEGTNGIELIYGPSDAGTFSGSIGINSVPGGAGNFISVTPGSPATTSTTVANNAIAVPPASGTIYTFTPPATSTITSAASGLWSSPATWTGGVIPNFASTVTIAGGHSITVDVSPTVASLTLGNGTSNDSLRFNGAAIRNLTVNGDLTVAAGAVLTTTPTTGTSARNIFLGGNFVNNGTVDMSSNGTLLAFGGAAVQTIGGTGTFANGSTIREIQVSNGLTINTPINVSARFTLVAGQLTTNNNLSMDNTLGGVATGGVNFRRSVVTPAINGAINVGTSAVYNLDYVFFTGQTAVNCTTSTEIPASRTINGIRLASAAGLHLYIAGGNLTLTSGSNSTTNTFPNTATAPGALLFSAGKFVVPSGSEIILSNGALANITGGSATAYIEGKLTWTVTSTTAQTRNFRVGDATDNFLVVLAGLNTGGTPQTFSVEMAGPPAGTGIAPITALVGTRTARITSSGSLGATATVQLNWTATDALSLGTPAELRVVQANAINSSWTERSASSTAGTLVSGNRTTTAGIDLANGEFFGFGTTAGSQIAIVAVASPNNSGCYTATETVRAVLRNTGGSIDYSTVNVTIRGSVTGPTGTITTLAPVTRAAGSLAAGATDTIVFATPVDFSLQGTHSVELYIDALVGQNLEGDTLRSSIRSTVYNVNVSPSTILLGGSAMLSVGTPDGIRFSEFTQFFGGVGQTGANYPAYVTSSTTDPDLLEITNFAGLDADMSGFQLEIVGVGARMYTFPANTVLTAGGVMVVHVGSGTDLPANNFYNTGGTNGAISSSSATGYILRDPSGFIVDAVAMNSYVFLAASGVTAADWSGIVPSTSGRAGAILASSDNNNASSWVVANSPAPLQTIGALNPGFIVAPVTVSWSGPGGFNATGASVSTGIRNTVGTETYTATITANGCAKTASGTLSVTAPVPPIAGITVSDTVATTGGVISTITLTDASLNIPTAWNWSVVPNNVLFVNNTSATSQVAQIQFTTPGIYSVRLHVSNVAGSDSIMYSSPIVVSLGYCASNATNAADTKIDSVVLGSSVFGSPESACETYTNNTPFGAAASIPMGQPFTIRVKSGYCGSAAYASLGKVFIDLNKNGIFESSEEMGTFGPLSATGSAAPKQWFDIGLLIPANNDTGLTRMRIVWQETSTFSSIFACGAYAYGETEDYVVHVGAAVPFVAELRSRSTTSATIVANANLAGFGGSAGVVYGLNPNPTLSDAVATIPSGTGPFIARLSGLLNPGTAYHARAYLQTQNGQTVIYSNELAINTFNGPQTQPIVPILSVRKPSSQAGTRQAGFAVANAGWGFLFDTLAVEAPLVVGRSAFSDSLGCDTSLVNAADLNGKIAVFYRGACGFSFKALAAVRAGAVGVIIINNASGVINLGSGPEGVEVNVPVMMISNADGAQLRPFIDNGEAVVLMGNKNGQFASDLALLQGETVGPDASSIFADMVAQPGQYVTPMGAYVLNAGTQATSQFYLQVSVFKDVAGQSPQQVYNAFQQLAPNTQPGQQSYLSVPDIDWGAANFGPGNYTIRYNALPWSGITDGYLEDNSFERRFSITDSLYAKTRLDSNGNLLLDGSGTRFGGVQLWAGGNWFEFQGSTNKKVNALRFAFVANPGQSLVGDVVEPQIWEWTDFNNDSLFTSNELVQIGAGFYTYTTNASNVQIESAVQNMTTGQPGVVLQPGRKYLFAVQYSGANLNVFLATDPRVNYLGTNRQTGKRISAVYNGTDWFSDGFGPQTVFAIAAVIGDAAPPALPIMGMVQYDNSANTPMSNTMVMLYEQQNVVAQTTTDGAGIFDFGAIAPGSYTVRAMTNKMWGGVNATDALAIARSFTGAAPLAGIRLDAADVNASETVNATDALQVARRFTNQINSFALGDWVFKADGFSHTSTQPTMVNVKALATGDVNGSYVPGNNRRMPLLAIEEDGNALVGAAGTWITAYLVQALELGAVSLEIQLPQGIAVDQVKSRLNGGEFTWHVAEGILYLSWYSLVPADLQENAALVDLFVRQTDEVSGSWFAGAESELANGWAEVHGPAQLRMPRLVDGSKGLFAASAYPNPTRDASTLNLNLPTTGKVSIRIVDALGRVMFESTQEQAVGSHQLQLPTERWAAGTYQISVLFEGDITEMQQLRLQVVR